MASTLRYGCTAPGTKGATRRSRAESACSARTDSSCQLLTSLIALLPGRLREGANALVFLVLARDAGPPEQEEVAVVTLARAEVILAQ